MNIRRTKLFLWYTTSGLILTTAVVVATASLRPYDVPNVNVAPEPLPTEDPSQQQEAGLPALSTFRKIWTLNLRRSLVDTPVTTQTKNTKKPISPLAARLAGTVVESGHSIAMFITPNGGIELKGVGEKVGDAEILGITQTGASVRYHGDVIDLTLENKKQR